jgi:hypothetical protein
VAWKSANESSTALAVKTKAGRKTK